jgi:predicted nucleic acid-binding protein
MSIDLLRALRRRRPRQRRTEFKPRAPAELPAVADFPPGRALLVPDTNVYIMVAAGTLPTDAQRFVERALFFHCSVCLAELATGIANADSAAAGWSAMRRHYEKLFARIPATRVLTPDAPIWIEAGVIAGVLARSQGLQAHQRKECLNDALIYLTAAKAGLPVLTANTREFDLIQQLAPEGRFICF